MTTTTELEPADMFKHGVARACAVDRRRFLDVKNALVDLRVYGSAAAVARVLDVDAASLETVGGVRGLHDRLAGTLLHGDDFGLGLYARFWPVGFGLSLPLVDHDRLYSPVWLEASPWLPWRMYDAAEALATIDWQQPMELEQDTVDAVGEHIFYDRDDHDGDPADLTDDERALRDGILDRWEADLWRGVELLRTELSALARRGGAFVTWEDENMRI